MPLFSILLPTHNRADVLPYAIQSALIQSVDDFELLVVGDGCSDDTASLVSAFDDPRIRWFDLPKGPHFGYANRNVALKQARGELIAFLGHDDLLLPDHLAITRDALLEPTIDLCVTRPTWVAPDGTVAPFSFNLDDPVVRRAFLAFEDNRLPACCVVHRRSCFDRVGYWDEQRPSCGDWDLWLRIITSGNEARFRVVDEATALHFRANWRQGEPGEMAAWSEFYDNTTDLPAELRLTIPDGQSEQAVFWQAISQAPGDWQRRLRRGFRIAFDRRRFVADRPGFDMAVRCQQQQAETERLGAVNAEQSQQLTALQQQAAVLQEEKRRLAESVDHVATQLAALERGATQRHDALLAENKALLASQAQQHALLEGMVSGLARQLGRQEARLAQLGLLETELGALRQRANLSAALTETLAAAQARLHEQSQTLAALEQQRHSLGEIHRSAGWATLQRLRAAKRALAPTDSLREALWNVARDGLARLLRDGE